MTAIDSFHEFLGYRLAMGISQAMGSLLIPLIVGLCGCVYTFVRASERGEPRGIVTYLFYLVLAVWMTGPATRDFGSPEGQPVQLEVPRILLWSNLAVDGIVHRSIKVVNNDFSLAPFHWERIERASATARIHGPLMWKYRAYLNSCYSRYLGRTEEMTPPLEAGIENAYLNEDTVVIGGRKLGCADAARQMRRDIHRHMRDDPVHREILKHADPDEYFRSICLNEWLNPHLEDGEGAMVQRSVGDLSLYDTNEWSRAESFGDGLRLVFGSIGLIKQQYALEQEPRQKRYLVVLFAPHLYGFVLLILLGLFPVVAVWGLAPGGWKAFVGFGKVFLSVKLWPVVWAALTFAGTGDGDSMRHVYMAAVGMYLVTPALTFLIVNLATKAAAVVVTQAAPNQAGAVAPQTIVNAARTAGSR